MVDAPAFPSFTPAPYASLEDVYTVAGMDRFTAGEDAELLSTHLQTATDVLWAMTARQFTGRLTTKMRPCCGAWLSSQSDDWWRHWGYPFAPDIVQGRWYNNVGPWGQACIAYECGIEYGQFDTGAYPVHAATAKIDGAAFDGFRIDRHRYLIRTDGGLWPTTQDVRKPDTEPGTWSVDVTHGLDAPPSLVRATAVLAAELTKHSLGDDGSAIPLSVTFVTRAGSTYAAANLQELIDRGATGIYQVDIVVHALNPNGLSRPPRVASLDRRQSRHYGG